MADRKPDENQKKQPSPQEQQGTAPRRGGTMNSPGDANESGSAGSTRRDDTTTPGNQR